MIHLYVSNYNLVKGIMEYWQNVKQQYVNTQVEFITIVHHQNCRDTKLVPVQGSDYTDPSDYLWFDLTSLLYVQ